MSRCWFPRAPSFAAVLLAAVGATVAQMRAQSPAPAASPASTGTSTSRPDALWRCELPGGVYLVALRSLASVSSHEYVVDGAARVTEVTVATNSSVEARFYFLEPVGVNASSPLVPTAALDALRQRAQELGASHSPVEDVWQKVVKSYPASTHAHTVEYRLTSKANLLQLYQSLELAWTTGKGANFKTQ